MLATLHRSAQPCGSSVSHCLNWRGQLAPRARLVGIPAATDVPGFRAAVPSTQPPAFGINPLAKLVVRQFVFRRWIQSVETTFVVVSLISCSVKHLLSERKHTEGDIGLLEGPEESSRIEDIEGSKRVARPAAATGAGEEGAEETATQRPKSWLSERSYGDFSRVFTFPTTVNQDRVQAKFKDGILEVTVPRAEKRSGKRIAIQ